MNKIILMLMILILAVPVFAEKKQATRVEADKMDYFQEKKLSIFYGNVVAHTQDNVKITADKMEVFFADKKEIKEIFCYGNVKIEQEDGVALSEKAHMIMATDTVILTKNVRVWKGNNYFEGERAVANSKTGKLTVDRGGEKRVKIIFTPEEEK